ncbi:Histone H2B [Carpediemonas membranifera]|uniref:Histone H2B n=1 Tax=Carpediemonas membranifera TaxID=201153 RepID=A0A8J6E3I9_9EUKA|nr:Histone H2B [Carpediemonas membranifera]KAG9395993.1 Histone H2B [Carpediemonas membranifera]|eukprot:KAG9392618.1 Histone H2B [Carpediemonas membranifera]
MAPKEKKETKPAAEKVEKTHEGPARKKARKETYHSYIYRVLRQVHPDFGISTKGMNVMDSLVVDLFERIAEEAGRLARLNKRSTLSSREIHSACRLVLPGELSRHAISEGTKSITKYQSNAADEE